jgi:YfiH family protein
MGIWKKAKKNGITLLSYDEWKGVSCYFSTRIGGVSPSPYESLNLGLSSGDIQENVLENRIRFYETLGIDSTRVIIPGQVHGNEVRIVNSELGIMNSEFKIPKCDGLLTQESGLVLGVTVADCLAVCLYDPRKNVIGILHAGWRGIAKGIVREAMRKMNENYGTIPEDCEILLSPSIGSCCYEVKEDVYEPITESLGGTFALEKRNGKVFLDLSNAAKVQLEKEGVKNIHLQQNDLSCTSCLVEDYFSYRKEGKKTGRMLAMIWLK